MVVALNAEIEKAVKDRAQRSGKPVEEVVNEALRRQFLPRDLSELPPPRDDWERKLRSIGVETGVALTDEQLSREHHYD